MKVKHYHIIDGFHGCIPENNHVASNMTEARQILLEQVRMFRKAGYSFTGNIREAYYEEIPNRLHRHPNYYLMITDPCDNEECLEDLDIQCMKHYTESRKSYRNLNIGDKIEYNSPYKFAQRQVGKIVNIEYTNAYRFGKSVTIHLDNGDDITYQFADIKKIRRTTAKGG